MLLQIAELHQYLSHDPKSRVHSNVEVLILEEHLLLRLDPAS